MTTPINPYVAGNPVGDSPAFIGRADVLREVLRVLRRPQDNAIVLYGQRRIGKTSILQHLAAQLPREGPYRPVYFDLQDKAAWPLGRVLGDLARTIAHTLGQPDPDLGSSSETNFSQTWLSAILGNLPDGSSLILLFDEFDVLADPQTEQAATAFFPYLRSLLASDPQRLKFVFAIGSKVSDLTTIALSLFKGVPSLRVSLLSRDDTADLVRLSERNNTLSWPDEAVKRVWQLTHGHPFLTQQLCSHVWELAHDKRPDQLSIVTPEDVDAASPDALEASRNTLEWLWDGLPPAERVVASALAEAGPRSITQNELEQLLRESGVHVVIRELQDAPQLLQDWDLIEPADGGSCFRVELLRQWIARHKPLRRVQEELDRIEPVAENLYQAAWGLYRGGQLEQAIAPLRQAITLNPNHVGANQLLADILLAQGNPGEARQLLERLYEYQPAAARHRLVQALQAQVQYANDDDERLAIYERVLRIDITQSEATVGWQRIWQQRGDTALASDDLATALEAYRTAGLPDKVAEIKQEMRRRDLVSRLRALNVLEQERRYQAAMTLVCKLADEYPETRDWILDLERLERKNHLAEMYRRALRALESGDRQAAQNLLAQVIAVEPGYEEATRYLHLAVTGADLVDLQARLRAERNAREKVVIMVDHQRHSVELNHGGAVIVTDRDLEGTRKVEVSMPNPFFYGNPVSTDQFIGRRQEIRRITSRIINLGQSTAVVGEWRTGKTSLLLYLAAPETRTDLYGADSEHLLFAFVDAERFGSQFNQAQFWEYALRPLQEQVVAHNVDLSLTQAYQLCREHSFGDFDLENLFARMSQIGWRLVLMLDEFDSLMYHPILNSAEFFGSLRGLASCSRGALALVTASRRSLANLNDVTRQISRTGSPYFNFLDEITLGPFSDRAIAELLRRAGDRFTKEDRRFILEVTGGHPYLLQLAASALWNAYEENQGDPDRRRQQAGQDFYKKAMLTLGDMWRHWSPQTRKAFTAVALAHIDSPEHREDLLRHQRFNVQHLLRDMTSFQSELHSLERHGFVAQDANIPGGWRVRPGAFLWWLAEELGRTERHEMPFEEWLKAQELEGLLTRGEKQQLDRAARSITDLLKGSVNTLIQAAAKGAGEAMFKTK